MLKEFHHKKENLFLFFLFLLGVLIFLIFNLLPDIKSAQFESLAKAFLNGQLYLSGSNNLLTDASYYQGFVYWPQGPFPAILLMPFIFLSNYFHQGIIQLILNLLNLFLLYKIAFKITENRMTSLWLSFAYVFSTAYLMVGLFGISWWFAQVVATSALLLSLYEFLHKKRWFLIGVYLAFALATRIDLIISVTFFGLSIISSKDKYNQKINQLFKLILPILVGLLGILTYNFARFGSIIEFGYKYHLPALTETRAFLKQYGAWNIFYFPTNIYYLFLKIPDAVFIPGTKYLMAPFIKANYWGMSIFLTSPIFLWCFKANLKEKLVKPALLTTLLLLIFILGYFGIGANQFGYRYALDFYPFLFLILCFVFKSGMGKIAKGVTAVSFIFNFYLISGLIHIF